MDVHASQHLPDYVCVCVCIAIIVTNENLWHRFIRFRLICMLISLKLANGFLAFDTRLTKQYKWIAWCWWAKRANNRLNYWPIDSDFRYQRLYDKTKDILPFCLCLKFGQQNQQNISNSKWKHNIFVVAPTLTNKCFLGVGSTLPIVRALCECATVMYTVNEDTASKHK